MGERTIARPRPAPGKRRRAPAPQAPRAARPHPRRRASPLAPLAPPLALLALAVVALLLVYARPLTYTITVGEEGDRAATRGFFGRERSPSGLPFRWTSDRATLIFRGAGLAFPANQPVALELPLVGSRPAGAPPARVTVAVNGAAAGEAAIAGEERLRLPAGAAFPGPVDTQVTLGAETFTPPGDRRALGVAVLGPARLAQEPGPGIALPPWGAWWRWLGAVLCGYGAALALTRRRAGRLPAALAGGLLALALTGAALIARPLFWQLLHLPLLALALALPLLWRRAIAGAASRAVAAAGRRWGLGRPALALAGLALLIPAQALLTAGRAPLVALALYAAGLAVTLSALLTGEQRADGSRADAPLPSPTVGGGAGSGGLGRGELIALAGVLVLAAGARFYRLEEIPFGLWRDEARHGNEALRILADPDYRPVYIPNISLPGLYPLTLAAAFRLFGAGVESLRGLTAGAGVAAVAALFAVARRLWGPRVALVAAFLAAVGSWRVSIDRLAFDTAPTTLCTLLALYAFLRGIDAIRQEAPPGRALLAFAAAGLAAGLAVYNYYPGRFAIVALAFGAALLPVFFGRRVAARALPGLALLVVVAGLTLIPLARYAVERPDEFFKRSGQVFLLSPQYLEGLTELEAVERNVARHLVMFNWQGEPNARHHAPKWPMLDAVTALCFALGLALAVATTLGAAPLARRFSAAFALGWLTIGLVPSVVSADAPSAVRAQDAAPAAYLLAALGFVALWRALAAPELPAAARRAVPAAAAAALVLAAGINLWLYFARLPGDPRVLDKFQYVGETRAGLLIAAAHGRDPALVAYLPRPYVRDRAVDEVLRFTAGDAPLRELPADGALPPGPALIAVPRGEGGADFERQLAAARRVAAASGLREVPGAIPPGGGPPVYVAFVR